MKTFLALFTAVLTSSLLTFADPIADLANAKCISCHSPTGDSAHIDGQHADYSFKSMMEYKNKIRSYDMMYKRVAKLDEATIKGLAEYFSRLTPATGKKGDPALMAQGKALYEQVIPGTGLRSCSECHGKNGEGGGFGSGLNARLASQHSDFTISQMAVYKAGTIPNQPEMTQLAQKLNADQVKALAEYIQSL